MSILSLLNPIPKDSKYEDVLKLGKLDFNAGLKELYFKDDNGNEIVMPFHRATYHKGTIVPFGVVGGIYNVSQYRSTFSICEVLENETGVEYVSAGIIGGGQMGFIVMKTPDFIELSPGHKIECHFYLTSSHDGSTCIEGRMIPVVNSGSVAGLPDKAFKIRHTKNSEQKMAIARSTLSKVKLYWKEAKDAFTVMAKLPLTDTDVKDYLEVVIEGDATRAENVRGEIMDVYNSSLITSFPCTNKTMLGAYLSVVHWVDGFKGVKKSKKRNEEDALIHSRLVGAGAAQKSEAYADALDICKKFGVL